MKGWNEVKTVLTVMKHGTVSGAAKELGVHRATVLRHVDALENELKTKLFVRHANGYFPTETGKALSRIAKITEDQFDQFSRRIKYNDNELEGDLVITSLDLICPLLMPAIRTFQSKHPKVMVNYQTSEDIFKLEYGQAHVAIRTGGNATEDDYVFIPFIDMTIGLYAHENYVKKYGVPQSVAEFQKHYFVLNAEENDKPVMHKWLKQQVPSASIRFRCNSRLGQAEAIAAGIGIGLMPKHEAKLNSSLVHILPEQVWNVNNWIVTHGDLHRSEKVQSFLEVLKSEGYRSELERLLGG